ncbi:MAG: aminoglycoside phosphotransferase family protein [candidate division WOR-3 bacterium]
MEILEVLQDGSDRVFYRILYKGKVYILLKETKRYRFENYLKVAGILGHLAPKIFDYNLESLEILIEDLGDLSLFEYIRAYKDYKIYYDVISILKDIQALRVNLPIFDYEHLKYEIDYFLDFNQEYSKFREFLYENSMIVSKFEYSFMHRDFQSRNIIIKDGRIRLIDFQSAHFGPKLYDLSSVLIDPYVNLEDFVIEELLRFYSNVEREQFLRVSLQRICQVNAAFKKLSRKKEFFKQFIPIAKSKFKELIKAL